MEFGGVDFGRGDRQPGLSLSLSLSLSLCLFGARLSSSRQSEPRQCLVRTYPPARVKRAKVLHGARCRDFLPLASEECGCGCRSGGRSGGAWAHSQTVSSIGSGIIYR